MFDDDCSLYLALRLIGKLKGKSVGDIWLIDGVDGSESVSGRDDSVVSEQISFGSFTNLGLPWVYECEVQYGKRSVDSGGLKDFHEFVLMLGLNLDSLMEYLKGYVVK